MLRNSDGWVLPLYFSPTSGLNVRWDGYCSKGWATHLVRQAARAFRCWAVRSGPRPPIRLVACIAPALDGGSSVFMSSFPENLALVAVGPWVGRRYGNVITSVITTDRHPRWLAWRRRVHRGRSTFGPSTASMRWFDGASA